MPPPLPLESDVESIAEDIPSTAPEPSIAKEEPIDTKMKEEEDEEEVDEEDGETFVVEAIKDHRSDFEDGQMRYHVKWKGYEKKADQTWETEENLDGAREVMEEYWKALPNGKPVAAPPKSVKKRGRASSGSKKEVTKRPRNSKSGARNGRKSNGALDQDTTPTPLDGFTEVGDDDWKPPPANDNAWDPIVQSVETVMRENNDGDLWGYVIWNNKNEGGRYYRSKAKLSVLYRACPQRMLHFYEKHLVFSTTAVDQGDETGV